MEEKNILVIGAGPAGIMAAIRAAQLGKPVTLIEKNPLPGRKLLLSGKGRCNLTNSCDLDLFIRRFSGNGAFLRDAFKKFFHRQLMQFFEERGLKLKIERQLRVFPVSDKAASILEILLQELRKNKVNLLKEAVAEEILAQDKQVTGVRLKNKKVLLADKVILATGGVSYKFTGSSGDGFKMAQHLGHKIIPLRAGLVPIVTKEAYPRQCQGLTLKNIRLKFSDGKRQIISEIGELLFTDSGISGPLVLSLSGQIVDWLTEGKPDNDLGKHAYPRDDARRDARQDF